MDMLATHERLASIVGGSGHEKLTCRISSEELRASNGQELVAKAE